MNNYSILTNDGYLGLLVFGRVTNTLYIHVSSQLNSVSAFAMTGNQPLTVTYTTCDERVVTDVAI